MIRKSKVTVATLAVLLLLTLILVRPWDVVLSANERYFHQKLHDALNNNVRSIPVQNLTDFSWDQVCAFAPYVTKDEVERVVGRAFTSYHRMHWVGDDSYWTLVFLSSGSSDVPIRIPRMELGDYRIDVNLWGKCEPHDSAVLKISIETKRGLAPYAIELVGEHGIGTH